MARHPDTPGSSTKKFYFISLAAALLPKAFKAVGLKVKW